MDTFARDDVTTIDARTGLSAEVLAELRSAREFYLARKSETIGLFGYWREPSGESRQLVVLVLQNRDVDLESPPVTDPFVVYLAVNDSTWQRTLRVLEPGDQIHLQWASHAAALVVQPPGPRITISFIRTSWSQPREATVHMEVAIYREPLSKPLTPAAGHGRQLPLTE